VPPSLAIIDLQLSKIKQLTVIYDSQAGSSTYSSVILHLRDPVQKKIMPPNQTLSRAAGTGPDKHPDKRVESMASPTAAHFQSPRQISLEPHSLCWVCSSQ
jgi:hypothetical protein